MSSACCHISVARWINAFKGKTSDVVNFEQITDPIRPPVFLKNFLFILTVTNFVFDLENHTRKKMKSS